MKEAFIDHGNISLSSKKFDIELLRTKVKESAEEMVSLPEFFASLGIPVAFAQGDGTVANKKQFFLRKQVAHALALAAMNFSRDGYVLKVEDAYRSLDTQKMKFLTEVNRLQSEHPDLSLRKLKRKANTYVAGIPILAAHTAGAAVDVTLVDKVSMQPVDFGTFYPDLSDKAITESPNVSEEVKQRRIYFSSVLEKYGLVNYPFEFWHYSMGDVGAAYIGGKSTAVYAPVYFDSESGKIISTMSKRAMKSFFPNGKRFFPRLHLFS